MTKTYTDEQLDRNAASCTTERLTNEDDNV